LPVPPPEPDGETPPAPARPPELVVPKTKTSRTWVAVGVGLFVLLLVIIFIAQNLHTARLNFLWLHGNVTIGLALSLAFVLGGLVVLLLSAARLAQLRLVARRHRREDDNVR
jgi:uncharacterized integral membrane protein